MRRLTGWMKSNFEFGGATTTAGAKTEQQTKKEVRMGKKATAEKVDVIREGILKAVSDKRLKAGIPVDKLLTKLAAHDPAVVKRKLTALVKSGTVQKVGEGKAVSYTV